MQQGRFNEDNEIVHREVRIRRNGKHLHKLRPRPWPVKALTLLLLTQGVGLLLLGIVRLDIPLRWVQVQQNYFYALLPILGVLALVAAVGFPTLRPSTWIVAMLVQGLTLLLALVFYFHRQPDNFVLYGLMLYSIVMVLYLNYADVPTVFRVQQEMTERIGGERHL